MIDLAFAPDESGEHLVAHRADCPTVRRMAADGVFVATMLGCDGMPPADVPRHDCLNADIGTSGR